MFIKYIPHNIIFGGWTEHAMQGLKNIIIRLIDKNVPLYTCLSFKELMKYIIEIENKDI